MQIIPLILLLFVQTFCRERIIFISLPILEHIEPLNALAIELHSSGFNVSFASFAGFQDLVDPTLHFISLGDLKSNYFASFHVESLSKDPYNYWKLYLLKLAELRLPMYYSLMKHLKDLKDTDLPDMLVLFSLVQPSYFPLRLQIDMHLLVMTLLRI
jgi:UDP:flavonoid glycosyltransferase YjiC (YdhE family)